MNPTNVQEDCLPEALTAAGRLLVSRLAHGVRKLAEVVNNNGRDDMDLRALEYSNVFGIFGPRGAGKSTILNSVRNRIELANNTKTPKRDAEYDTNMTLSGIRLLPTIDCSVIPSFGTLGAAVLTILSDHIARIREKHSPDDLCSGHAKQDSRCSQELGREQVNQLERLTSACSITGSGYQDLCVELSTSPSDYTQFFRQGTKERLSLWRDLYRWINSVLNLRDHEVLCVILDDFDMVPDAQARQWLFSLLDELRQPRLVFLIAADFNRLQHLVWDPDKGFDDKTGRAILQKIIPPQNLVNIDSVSFADRRSFRPFRSTDEDDTLLTILKRTAEPEFPQFECVLSLLPESPRGLFDLYQSLSERTDHCAHNTRPRAEDEPPKAHLGSAQILSWIATSRGEPLLARELERRLPDQWLRAFRFSRSRRLSPEDWNETVDAAAMRPRRAATDPATSSTREDPIPPLRCLELDDARSRPGRRLTGTEHGPWNDLVMKHPECIHDDELEVDSEPDIYRSELSHDPKWRDPLRHDRLWRLPLRDAAQAAVPQWIEILVDRASTARSKDNSSAISAIRRRVGFLHAWPPAAQRMARARIEIDLMPSLVREFFAEWEGRKVRAALTFLEIDPERMKMNSGWAPLLSALRGQRDPIQHEQLGKLLVNWATLEGDMPEIGAASSLEVIPSELWASILLIDSLDRCPWAAYSVPLGLQLSTYLMLAGALIKTAYIRALREAGHLELSSLVPSATSPMEETSPQSRLLEVLDTRDPQPLFPSDPSCADGLLELLIAVLDGEPSPNKAEPATTSPLEAAARTFLGSAPYRAVQELARETRSQMMSSP